MKTNAFTAADKFLIDTKIVYRFGGCGFSHD